MHAIETGARGRWVRRGNQLLVLLDGGEQPQEEEEQFFGRLVRLARRDPTGRLLQLAGTSRRGLAPEAAFTIEDRTGFTDKKKRGTRKGALKAVVLHQMGFSYTRRGNNSAKYDDVTAHYAILADGKILQLHPDAAKLDASDDFNSRSVAIEFAGNFPSIQGRCYKPETYGCDRVTDRQIKAGRYLVQHLVKKLDLTHVFAHCQSSKKKKVNDPGPDLWYGVGQWAVDTLGLKDGGPGFKVGRGIPIPKEWRIWGKLTPGFSDPLHPDFGKGLR